MRKLLIISLLAVLAFLLVYTAGCGEDSTTVSLSKKQFVKRAKVICSESETEQFGTVVSYLQAHPGLKQEEAMVPAGLPPIEKELNKLKALGSPSGGEAELEDFFQALEKAIAETKKDPGSALTQKGNPFDKPNELAESYGLEGCSGNP
jgi:hypothetical protein